MSQKKIGAKIVIDGEQEFRAALNQSKNALKEFDSELKLVTSQFKNNEKSMEALKSKQAVYQKQQQELTKQSKLLVEQIQKASTEYKKASEVQAQQADKIKKLEKALEEAKKEYGDSADEVKTLERELSEANEEYEKQERAINGLSDKITKWNTDLNKTKTQLNETDRALDETNDSIEHYDTSLDKAERETNEFGSTMGGAAKNTESLRVSLGSLVSAQVVVDVLRNCAHAIKEVATAAIDVGAKFTASMSNVEALSGATGETLEALGNKAREMGAKTIYSASESADAFSYMALAGWNAEQMLEGIEPVLNLAAAANMDLAEASDIVTDYITAFGLKASDAAHFSDAMARAMSTSNTTVELLGESYKNVAATCGSMGIAMEDATAVLATMANAGVKGGEAGTALNSILTRLATNTSNAGDKLEALGVHVYDASGKMNSISSILNGIAKEWGNLSQQEQAALAKSIAGTRQYSKFQTIMLGVSEAAKEGGQSFDDYAASLRDCDGAAEAMAKTMQDNLTGDITILKSALEGLGIATESAFDDSFRIAVQGATDAVSRLEKEVSNGELGASLASLGDSIGNMTANLVEAAEDALPGFVNGLTWLVDNIDLIGGGLKTATAAFVAYKVASIAATISTESFTAALAANPIGAVAVAVTALTVGFIEMEKHLANVTGELSEEGKETVKLTNESRELNDSIRDSADARKQEAAQMDAQATAARRLVSELFNETTTQTRRAQIISELKSIYPQLNIAMDEHGKLIGATQQQMERYIETSLQMAKVEAAKEHLTEIAKEQFEAESKLAEIEEQVKDAVEDVHAAERAKANDAKNHVDVSGELVEVYNEYDLALGAAKDALSDLEGQQKETTQTVADLGDEYQRTLDYIENNEAIDQAADSTRALAEAEGEVSQITSEMQKEFDDLYESIQKSVSSSLDLTNKWSAEWNTSTGDMTSNIESQIEGIQNWADNFDKLANTSEVAIDSRVMKYLADMGTEGAGLVQQLVDTLESSPEQLQDFSNKMAEYLTLEDSVAAEITDSYVNCFVDGMNGAAEAITENSGLLTSAAQAMSDEIAAQMTNVGHGAVTSMQEALQEGTPDVTNAAKAIGTGTVDAITKETGKNGEKIGEIGAKANEQLADGLNQDNAVTAATELSKAVHDAAASELTESAGYSIGADFMGALTAAIEEEGKKAIAAAAAAAEAARDALKNPGGDDDDGGGGGGENPQPNPNPEPNPNPNPNPGPTGMGATGYVPPSYASVPSVLAESYIQTADALSKISDAMGGSQEGSGIAQVNVELSGSASDIFTVVRNQNTKLVTATGYHALS